MSDIWIALAGKVGKSMVGKGDDELLMCGA